jgi:pimeloyl-ACP methyl ester carboxylesterase
VVISSGEAAETTAIRMSEFLAKAAHLNKRSIPAVPSNLKPPRPHQLPGTAGTGGNSFNQLGCNVLVIDYRGYGATFGTITPTESSVYHDAEVAWNYLTETRGIAPERILIYGHSLGGAIAIELATRHPEAGGIVVESSFTSVKQMARWKFAITYLLPLDLLLRHRFD